MPSPVVRRIAVGLLETNCWIVHAEDATTCAVVDPGGDGERIIDAVRDAGLEPEVILPTHSHFDHVGAVDDLRDAFPDARVLAHPVCAERMTTPEGTRGALMGENVSVRPVDGTVADGERVPGGGLVFVARHLPGHAPGHLVFLVEGAPVLFSGDTIFAGSIGRHDFPGSSREDLLDGLARIVTPLPEETRILPGHGPETTVGREIASNPFLQNDRSV